MRTSDLISEISYQAKIMLGNRMQLLEADRQRGLQDDEELQLQYATFFSVSNSIYVLDEVYLTDTQKDIVADTLIRQGFYFDGTNRLFSELLYNDADYDTA